jgi:hypothetical protein
VVLVTGRFLMGFVYLVWAMVAVAGIVGVLAAID